MSSPPRLPVVPGFVVTERIGSGSYATVYKAYLKGEDRHVVAIKCVGKKSLTNTSTQNLITEIELLKKLKHEYIVEMKDFIWDDDFIFIIMEFCSGGDLSTFIRASRTVPEIIVKKFLQQLAKALEFLRSKDVCHMDLKPQNILLSSIDDPSLKLADFGFAQYLQPHDDATTLRGSPLYMAPEMLLREKYDARVDLWSVGVILYECLFGRPPYSSKTFADLIEKIKDPKPIQLPYGVNISDSCRDLLKRLLQRDPDKRLTYEEFFRHEFLDLEHMPSPNCYPNAFERLHIAVEFDKSKCYSEAVQSYCEALRYLVPAIQYEKNPRQKEALRARAKEYMNRAEILKTYLKPKQQQQQLSNTSEKYAMNIEPTDESMAGLSSKPYMVAVVRMIEAAEELENQEKFKDALRNYHLALDTAMQILKDEQKGHSKDLLASQIQKWMTRAEYIQNYLSIQSMRVSVNREDACAFDSADTSYKQQCCLQ